MLQNFSLTSPQQQQFTPQPPQQQQQFSPQKPQQSPEQQLPCPRCQSTNTKFCYYNNYNLSQPRHFCKSCKRYWTKGGTLRNIPIGGSTRKTSKRSKRSSTPILPQKPPETPKPELAAPLCPQLDLDHGSVIENDRSFSSLLACGSVDSLSPLMPMPESFVGWNEWSELANFRNGSMFQ